MKIKLYDLAAAEVERRFSPYCWRTKLALAHKGLTWTTVPCRLADKEIIAFSGQDAVPVLVDGDEHVSDSWAIANYLEETYPQQSSLFEGASGWAAAGFINAWSDTVLASAVRRLTLMDVFTRLHEDDKAHFRRTREARFGTKLEQVSEDVVGNLRTLRDVLEPLRKTLAAQPFLGGARPLYADYSAFGPLQWARCISPIVTLESDDPIYAWRERILDLFDGLARDTPAYG